MPPHPPESFLRLRVSVLRAELARRGWTQREFARRAAMSPQTVTALIYGWRNPGPETRRRMLKALGWRFDRLFEVVGPEQRGKLA